MQGESTASGAAAGDEPPAETRRGFLSSVTSLAMLGGLAAGYGMFFSLAGQFLFPSRRSTAWLFAAHTGQLPPGESALFVSPSGVPVVIKRNPASDGTVAATVEDFVALSSTCPHLGCRVHWEGQHQRFFCPCHNGTFDPEGRPTGGPPLAADQHLPRYPLRLENGLLFIEFPIESLGKALELTADAQPVLREGLCLGPALPPPGGHT